MALASRPPTQQPPTRPPLLPPPTPPPPKALYCVRAGLREGQDILELGCGWGSLSLFMARAFPGSRVTAVSNSRTQREYIVARAKELGARNLVVLTADMVDFQVGRLRLRAACVFERVIVPAMPVFGGGGRACARARAHACMP